MSFPSQESQSEFNHCPDLTAMVHNVDQTPLAISPDDLTQRSLNSQFQPHVEVETGSVAQNGDGSSSWGLPFSDMPLDSYWKDLDVDLSSVAQTEDLSPISTSKTDMPGPGGGNANELPQQFNSSDQPLNSLAGNLTADQLVNSHGDVETEVRCSEPNQSHLDHEERPSDQASNGRKQRGRKPRVIPVEKSKNQLDQAGTSAKAGNGQKRRSRKPIIRTEEQENERKKIKKEIDRRYRRGKKNELTELRKLEQDLDRVMTIASGFGRIDQMVSQINRMSCELQKMQQEEVGNGMFLQEIIDSADRVPPIRANEVQVYAWSDKCKGHHGTQSSDLDRVNGTHSWLLTEVSNDEINLRLPAAVRGANTMHDMQYSDASVTKFMAKLDDDKAMSNVDLSSFKDLDGECEKVGNYNIPLCLVSTAQDIIKAKDDITKQSRFGQCVIEPAYILLCAAIKEMMDLPLEQATEEIMLKWRDAINDAKGLRFETEFAMEYMRKFARGYFGLKAKNDRESLELGMTILKTEEEVLKMELEKKTNEMKVLKAKEKDLTSEQCKDCLEFKNQILTKTIRLFD